MLPPSANIPWKPDDITIRTQKGYVLNEKQVDYFKYFVRAIQSMYSDISNAVNLLDSRLSVLEDRDIVCLNDQVVCHNDEVVYT